MEKKIKNADVEFTKGIDTLKVTLKRMKSKAYKRLERILMLYCNPLTDTIYEYDKIAVNAISSMLFDLEYINMDDYGHVSIETSPDKHIAQIISNMYAL